MRTNILRFTVSLVFAFCLVGEAGAVDSSAIRKSALPTLRTDAASVDTSELILSAPPRDTEAEGVRRFGPVAAYLSKVLGRKVVYKYPGSWGAYQSDMIKGRYDLVFDGPHFVGWRIEKSRHNVLVKVPGDFIYTAVVRVDETDITRLDQLAGHRICAHSTPNLGTLIMLQEFSSPFQQPAIVITHGYDHIYKALLAGKCDAAMLPLKHWQEFEHNSGRTRVIFQNNPLPQQALTAGPRIAPDDQEKIRKALLSWESREATAVMRAAYGIGQEFVPARNEEYAGVGRYLKDEWGFY